MIYNKINQGTWCQESWETGEPGIRKRASALRKAGYQVTVSAMGPQRTGLGTIKLTMVDIRPGRNGDTSGV